MRKQLLVLLEIRPDAIDRVPVIHGLMAETEAAGAACAVPQCVTGAAFRCLILKKSL